MSIRRLVFGFSVLGAWVGFVPQAQALDAECASKLGDCSVSNQPEDSISCECVGGAAGGGGGGNEWAGLNQAQLDAVCLEQLDAFCGPPPPLEGVPCESKLGTCTVDNEPDSIICDCTNGGGIGGGGGNNWDGLSDEELFGVCLEELDLLCGGPVDPEWLCEDKSGGCVIEFGKDPFVACGCTEGGGGGFPADPEWAGLSEDELIEVCFEQLDSACGGVDPSAEGTGTSGAESESSGGEGGTESEGTGTTGGTEEGTGETSAGEASDSDSVSASASASASASDSDSATESASASASASNTAGAEESSGGESGANQDDTSGCSCNANNDEPGTALGLGLLGLVGWGMRRRSRH